MLRSPRKPIDLAGSVSARQRLWIEGAAGFLLYLLLAVLYLGRLALRSPTAGTLGTGPDVQIFLWGLRWWPYAVAHGLNPVFSRVVWPPGGVDVLWSTTVPALSLVMSPITVAFGPAAAWNLLCVLAPAASAWAAWLLCRELTERRWPSLLGGAMFGFSSYELAEGLAHLQLTMSLLIPLAAHTVARHLAGKLGARGLVCRLAAIIVGQFLIAPELLVTMLLIATIAAIAAVILMADRRAAILRTTRLALIAVAVGSALMLPLVISMLTHRPAEHNASVAYPADLVNLVIPTRVTALGGAWTTAIVAGFPGNLAEQCAYLGVAMLLIILAFAIGERASPSARLLIVVLLASVVCSLGSRLTIAGHQAIWLPWALVSHLPLLADALPVRFALYTALTAAVITARWLSHPRGPCIGRWMLAIIAAASIVPAAAAARWQPTPPAIASDALGRLLVQQRVLSLPFYDGADRGLYAQAADGMRFQLIDSWMQLRPKDFHRFTDLRTVTLAASALPRTLGDAQKVRVFEHQLCEAQITRLLLWGGASQLLARLQLKPRLIGNVLVYTLPPCPTPPAPNAASPSSLRRLGNRRIRVRNRHTQLSPTRLRSHYGAERTPDVATFTYPPLTAPLRSRARSSIASERVLAGHAGQGGDDLVRQTRAVDRAVRGGLDPHYDVPAVDLLQQDSHRGTCRSADAVVEDRLDLARADPSS